MKAKAIVVLILGFILTFSTNLKSHLINNDTLLCLMVKGTIISDSKDGLYKIELFNNHIKVDSILLHKGHRNFHFYLDRNSFYEIMVSREGYQTKLIRINTSIPSEEELIFQFHFKVKLLTNKIYEWVNQEQHVNPIALVFYDEDLHGFNFSTSSISNDIKP